MVNPILQQLDNQTSKRNTPDYTSLMNDPRFAIVKQMLANGNMTAKEAFYNLAKTKGIEPEIIINQLKK